MVDYDNMEPNLQLVGAQFLWPPCVADADAGHYIFVLWFLLSIFFYFPPNLSCRGLDVYHTSTHGVALV